MVSYRLLLGVVAVAIGTAAVAAAVVTSTITAVVASTVAAVTFAVVAAVTIAAVAVVTVVTVITVSIITVVGAVVILDVLDLMGFGFHVGSLLDHRCTVEFHGETDQEQ